MKVKDLINYLKGFDPDALVVVHRDNLNYGYGLIDKIHEGVFSETDYGNDFVYDDVLMDSEVRAVCLFPEDNEDE